LIAQRFQLGSILQLVQQARRQRLDASKRSTECTCHGGDRISVAAASDNPSSGHSAL
jgi:hypothetical protein